jgi:hypothetical protein
MNTHLSQEGYIIKLLYHNLIKYVKTYETMIPLESSDIPFLQKGRACKTSLYGTNMLT